MTKKICILAMVVVIAEPTFPTDVLACSCATIRGKHTFDGRPAGLKYFEYGGNSWLIHDTSGTYDVLRVRNDVYVADYWMGCAINEKGLVLLSTGLGSSANYPSWISQVMYNSVTYDDVINSKPSSINWSKNMGFIGGAGTTFHIEVKDNVGAEWWEYNPDMRSWDYDITVRPNQFFANENHQEPEAVKNAWSNSTGCCNIERYDTLMNEIKNAIADNGNIDVYEMVAVLRWGERYGSGYTSVGQDNTLQTSVVLGSNSTNHGKYVTRLFTMSHPDFCIFIPAWVALGQANLSPYVTAHSGTGTIAYWGKKLLSSFKNNSTDDEYLSSLFAGLESNIIEGVVDARSKWFASGDQADFQNTINEMHQRSAWCAYHALKSAYNTRGSGRQCNDIPLITSMSVTPEGNNSISCSATATDSDGIQEYSWKFGDGSANVTGSNVNHPYAKPGTYMVSLIAKDKHTHMAANVKFKWVTVVGPSADAGPSPDAGAGDGGAADSGSLDAAGAADAGATDVSVWADTSVSADTGPAADLAASADGAPLTDAGLPARIQPGGSQLTGGCTVAGSFAAGSTTVAMCLLLLLGACRSSVARRRRLKSLVPGELVAHACTGRMNPHFRRMNPNFRRTTRYRNVARGAAVAAGSVV